MINKAKETYPALKKTKYVTKNPYTFYSDLIEAIATGRGPDIVIMDASNMLALKDKIQPVSYESFSLYNFRSTYLEGAEVFTLQDGIYGFPLVVDPLVLYWNRTLFTNAVIAQVPTDWDTFISLVPKLTILEGDTDITQSAIAFGEYNNVLHAKEILSALFMQTGVRMVFEDEVGGFHTDIGKSDTTVKPELAIRFYTNFSNPIKTVYSWNKTFDRSREAFAANKVAMYAGFASEVSILEAINPNLNYDIALFPQSASGRSKVTYGKFYATAMLKSSGSSLGDAFAVSQVLSSASFAPMWEQYTGLPTVRRDMLKEIPTDPHSSVIAQSALISRDWLQPGSANIDDTFARMVDNVVTGRASTAGVVSIVAQDIETLLSGYNK